MRSNWEDLEWSRKGWPASRHPATVSVALGPKQGGEVVEARRRVWMLGTVRLFTDRQCAFIKRPRPRKVALGPKQGAKVVEANRRIGMFRPETLLPDRERALMERPCARKVALGPKHAGEVVEGIRRIGMLGTERLFTDRQCAFIKRPRPRKVALICKQAGELVKALGPPPRSNGPRSNARPVNRTRCGSASSTSLTLAVSGRACRVTVATSVPPAVPCSRAVRRRRQHALGERRIDIALSPGSATRRPRGRSW